MSKWTKGNASSLFRLPRQSSVGDLAWNAGCILSYFFTTLIILALKMHITCLHEIKLDTLFSKPSGPTSAIVYALNIFIIELWCHMPVLSGLLWVQSNSARKKPISSTNWLRYCSKNKVLKRSITIRPKAFLK